MIDRIDQIKERRSRLQRACNALCGDRVTFLKLSDWEFENGEELRHLNGSFRILKTPLRFRCSETFIRPTNPELRSFQYSVVRAEDVEGTDAFFRYECHPELGGSNPYVLYPHFHPDRVHSDVQLRELHFPFTRAVRGDAVFAILGWLKVDFIKRFGHR